MANAKKPQSPKAARTKNPPVVDAKPTACPTCSSTEREPYFNVRERAIAGERDGRPYTHVVWRRTRCKACGQTRDDKAFEHRPATAKRRAA